MIARNAFPSADRTPAFLAAAALLLSPFLSGEAAGQDREPFDLLIRGGKVVDGTGNPAAQRDVGIRGDEIAAIGDLGDAEARRSIDAEGLHVVPGFIDLHPHAHGALLSDDPEDRQAYSLHHQGLTTIAGGADGRTPGIDLMEQVEAYLDPGTTMNVALMVGHNTIRGEVMDADYERPANPDEIDEMRDRVREGVEQGAYGITAGLEYAPGNYSTTEEIIGLARVVSEYDGFYVAHQRSEASIPLYGQASDLEMWPVDGQQGLEETIRVGREADLPVVASHHKARGRASWGRSSYDTVIVNEARDEGVEVYLDVYPYETFGGSGTAMMPRWAVVNEHDELENPREDLRRRWEDPAKRARIRRDIEWEVNHNGGPDRVYVLDHPDDLVVGETLADLAEAWDKDYVEVVVELQHTGYEDEVGGALTRGCGMDDHDVKTYYELDYTAMASDAGVSRQEEANPDDHPRHWGAFVRYLAHYVRDESVVPLSQGVRAMTGLPADIIGLEDRGLIHEGYRADVVILDYEALEDRATIFEPAEPAEGIEYVLVNGEITIEEGGHTGALPGEVLRKDR